MYVGRRRDGGCTWVERGMRWVRRIPSGRLMALEWVRRQKRVVLPIATRVVDAVSRMKNAGYDRGLLGTVRVGWEGTQTVCVGNVEWGGTGKTPLVAALAEQAVNDGKRVHVVVSHAGSEDEGVMLEERGFTVSCIPESESRSAYVASMHEKEGSRGIPPPDVLILDDGSQHRALHRDVDLGVVNAAAPVWRAPLLAPSESLAVARRRLLPEGTLREDWREWAQRMNAVVLNHAQLVPRDEIVQMAAAFAPYTQVYVGSGRQILSSSSHHRGAQEPDLDESAFHLVSSVGSPDTLRASLLAASIPVVSHTVFDDHAEWDDAGLDPVLRAVAEDGGGAVLVTAKDAARLGRGGLGAGVPFVVVDVVPRVVSFDQWEEWGEEGEWE